MKPVNGPIQSWPAVDWIAPDPPEELEIEMFGATRGLNLLTTMLEAPPEGSPSALPPWQCQHDHGVGSGKPDIEGSSIVAIRDPAVTRQKANLEVLPLLPRRRNPVGLPKVLIQVNDGDSSPTTQFNGECRLPDPSRPDDRDPLHPYKSGWYGDQVSQARISFSSSRRPVVAVIRPSQFPVIG